MSTSHHYQTQDVDLASFLLYENIPFKGCIRSPENPGVILMCFEDYSGRCPDLEIVFLRSEFKKYQDLRKQLLSRVHQALREPD